MRRATLSTLLPLLPLTLAQRAAAQQVLYQIDGPSNGDLHGRTVAVAGDVDADGVRDLIVGAPFDDPAGKPGAGTASVYSGLDGSLLVSWRGTAMNDHFGWAVAGAGDVDGDGHADVLVSTLRSSGINLLQLLSGGTGQVIRQWNSNADTQYGYALAPVGDVDGDGGIDVAVGAPQPAGNGYVHVLSMTTGFPVHVLAGAAAGDLFGQAVAGGQDVDGDGMRDFAVGAPQIKGVGYVRVYSGLTGALLWTYAGGLGSDEFGFAVALGDTTGDGRADVLVGDPRCSDAGPDAGQVRLYNGANGGLLALIDGSAAGDRFGYALAMPDVNDDGRRDLAIGAPGDDTGGFEAGSVSVRSGAGGPELGRVTGGPSVDGTGEHLGSALADLGDVTGDACAELAIGAPRQLGSLFPGYAVVVEYPCDLGSSYCDSLPNSTGQTGRLRLTGSAVVAANDLGLEASQCPGAQFGFFFFGSGQNNKALGDGILCVGGSIYRFAPAVQTGKAGSVQLDVDLLAPPAQGNIVGGSGWNFQFWFRDTQGKAGSNLTNAVHVDFL